MRVYNLTDVGRREDLRVYRHLTLAPGDSGEVPGFLISDPQLQRWVRQKKLAFEELPDWYMAQRGWAEPPLREFREFPVDDAQIVTDTQQALGHIAPPVQSMAEILAVDSVTADQPDGPTFFTAVEVEAPKKRLRKKGD